MIDYSKVLNKTVSDMKPSGIRKFFDIASTMEDVISLGVGEPDFQTPWQIRKAGIESLEKGRTKYTSNKGEIKLLREISKYMKRKYSLDYCPDNEILVTVGGSEAIDACVRAMVSAGDEVIIPQPSYVCYEPMTRLAGGVPVIINVKAENNFKVTAKELEAAITDKTKLLILPYPCNPTGAIMEKKDLEAIYEVIKDKNILILSDEIYSELTFGGKAHISPACIEGMKERTVIVNGFSKAFSMTGWRLGYAMGPKDIIAAMKKIHQFTIMCAPTISQFAGIEAIRNGEKEIVKMRNEYNKRRLYLLKEYRN